MMYGAAELCLAFRRSRGVARAARTKDLLVALLQAPRAHVREEVAEPLLIAFAHKAVPEYALDFVEPEALKLVVVDDAGRVGRTQALEDFAEVA